MDLSFQFLGRLFFVYIIPAFILLGWVRRGSLIDVQISDFVPFSNVLNFLHTFYDSIY